MIHNVIKHIDKHLYHKFIGGYELIKYIYQNNIFKKLRGTDRDKAKKLADIMGKNNLMPLGRDYFDHLIKYMNGICQEASSHNLYPSG